MTTIDGKRYASKEAIEREAQRERVRAMLADDPKQKRNHLISARSLLAIAKHNFGTIERKVKYVQT